MPAIRELDGGERQSSSHGTSRSLIERVRRDDVGAWDRLVSLYAPLVAHWCRMRRLTDDDAADVFQEVFQAVARHLTGFRRSEKSDTFRGWLRTITGNKIHDHFRRLQREPRGVGGSEALLRLTRLPEARGETASAIAYRKEMLPVEERTADPGEDAASEADLFRRGLELIRAEFEPRTWQAFWLTAVEDRAAADVAADLGMTPGAVRVAKSRVLHRLRAELGDAAGEE